MPKEGKKKNIVQDVIPPKRSIRNVEIPKSRHLEEDLMEKDFARPVFMQKEIPIKIEPIKAKGVSQESTPSYKYEYDEPKKSKKRGLYASLGLFIIVTTFAISALFKSAEIRLTPKQELKTLNETFTAKKDSTNNLGFQLVTISKDLEKTVDATGGEQVLKKARGKIVIYNNYNSQAQKLVATTRFQTGEGLIFRLIDPATVPGKFVKDGKTIAGSAEVIVEADKPGATYNIGLKDFTIPGFKGDPKYTQIYARSKTAMTGGFSGTQKVVSKEVMSQTDKDLETRLKDSLAKDIISQIPANFVLYKNSLSYKFEPTIRAVGNENANNSATDSALLRKHGTTNAIIFDKGLLSRAIIAKVLPDIENNIIKITNLPELNFAYGTGTSFDPNTNNLLTFTLKGEANLIWVFDENKLKSDLLGLSKKNAKTIISTYSSIKEAWIITSPFWNQTIPSDPEKVTLINTFEAGLTF